MTDVDALNAVLAVEHAAIFDLSAAGATLPLPARTPVLAHYDDHRRGRDALTARIRKLGGTPVAALPAYADPLAGGDAYQDIITVERAAVQAYAAAIAIVVDSAARTLCAEGFVAECRHLAKARAAAGQAGAPEAFVTGV